jgi:hypothetical protein
MPTNSGRRWVHVVYTSGFDPDPAGSRSNRTAVQRNTAYIAYWQFVWHFFFRFAHDAVNRDKNLQSTRADMEAGGVVRPCAFSHSHTR